MSLLATFSSCWQHPRHLNIKMTTGFANTHFIGSAFLTVTPSTALTVVGILFIMAPNEGESTVFKCSISSATYQLLQVSPTYLFCTEVQLLLFGWWGTSCRSRGRGFARRSLLNTIWWDLLRKLNCAAEFDVVLLKLDSTLSPAQNVQRTLIFSS